MKQKLAKTVLIISICGAVLAGCTSQTNTEMEPTASPSPTAEPIVTSTPSLSASAEVSAPPQESPASTPVSAVPGEEYTNLSFLTGEQQMIYHQAEKANVFLFGVPTNLDHSIFKRQLEDSSIEEPPGYDVYENSYSEFESYIYSIFTSNYIDSLGSRYTDKFIDYNGYLATNNSSELIGPMVEGVGRAVLDNYPDTYRLESQDDSTIRFTLIFHYDHNWNAVGDIDVFTIEYPICMVKTESGWRMEEFHTTMYG